MNLVKLKGIAPLGESDAEFPTLQHIRNAITGGIDAQAIVTVRLKNNQKITSASGSDTNVLVASALAYINCLEKLHL